MLSGGWSDSPVRALIEFDRALLYLLMLVFVVCTRAARGGSRRCCAGWRWRSRPPAWPRCSRACCRDVPDQGGRQQRAARSSRSPTGTRWGCSRRSGVILAHAPHRVGARAGGGAGRRGGRAAGPRGDALLHVLARRDRGGDRRRRRCTSSLAHPRGLLAALPAAGIPLARRAEARLRLPNCWPRRLRGPDARAQGRSLLVVVVACTVAAGVLRWLALRIDRRLLRVPHRRAARARSRSAARPSRRCSRSRSRRGVRPPGPDRRPAAGVRRAATRRRDGADLRSRLTKVGNNGRIDIWRVALRRGGARPVARRRAPGRSGSRGSGTAGAARPGRRRALALLRGAGRARLGRHRAALRRLRGAARRWRSRACGGPGRHAHAAFLAAALALLLHARVDWDWEMPALFVWFFGAAGAVIAAPARRPGAARAAAADAAARRPRVPAARGHAADRRASRRRGSTGRRRAARAATARTAMDAALDSLDALNRRPSRSRCSAGATRARGRAQAGGGGDAQRAGARPGNWHYAYGLAVAQALAGEDPRPAAALRAAPQPARAARDRARAGACAPQRRRGGAGRARAADPVRLNPRGGPEPASRDELCGVGSARRRCGAAGPGPR